MKTKVPEIREMCIAGIELLILNEDDISYMCDARNSLADVRYYYHCKLMEN